MVFAGDGEDVDTLLAVHFTGDECVMSSGNSGAEPERGATVSNRHGGVKPYVYKAYGRLSARVVDALAGDCMGDWVRVLAAVECACLTPGSANCPRGAMGLCHRFGSC